MRPPVYYPDSLVGTDSHTTMINGIGVVGWGVGGIEAEAAMLGQPVYFLTPDVVGFEFSGRLREGVTATDLVLAVTEILRREKVVGKFVEFFGAGTESLSVPDRATMANMAPEYGATMGFFPVDDKTIEYFQGTGRTASEIEYFQAYFKAQGLYGVPRAGQIDYSKVVRLDLGTVAPSLAGPKRPQDRIEIGHVKDQFTSLFSKSPAENGFNQPAGHLLTRHHVRAAEGHAATVDDAAANVPRTPSVAAGRAALRRGDGGEQADARRRAAQGRARAAAEQRSHDRQRRRPDRGDHLVHEHLEPERDDRRRPAREEGGRGRPHRRSRTSRPRSRRARASSPST